KWADFSIAKATEIQAGNHSGKDGNSSSHSNKEQHLLKNVGKDEGLPPSGCRIGFSAENPSAAMVVACSAHKRILRSPFFPTSSFLTSPKG
ncbi:MAG: hypothetical protein V1743_04750, partial [Nanoarchaeota archaeon]